MQPAMMVTAPPSAAAKNRLFSGMPAAGSRVVVALMAAAIAVAALAAVSAAVTV